MKLKQSLLLIITTFVLLMSANSHAGRQGINFYYGIGLGISQTEFIDIMPTADIVFGFEEDGWALEGIAFGSLEVGTDDSTVDTSMMGSHIGLAYRTIETNNNWFKFKVSSTKMDFDDSDTPQDYKTKGNSYTIGYGIRMNREARLELDYSYYDSSDLSEGLHMIIARYFWGGSEYQGKAF